MFSVVKWYIWGGIAASAISLAGMMLVIWRATPESAPLLLKALFFVALFIFIWSGATLAIFSIKSRFARSRLFDETAYEGLFYDSLLKGLLVAGILVAAVLIRRLL